MHDDCSMMRGQIKGAAALTCATSVIDVWCGTVQHISIWTIFLSFQEYSSRTIPELFLTTQLHTTKEKANAVNGNKACPELFLVLVYKIITCWPFLLYVAPTAVQWPGCIVPQALQSSFGVVLCYWFLLTMYTQTRHNFHRFLFIHGWDITFLIPKPLRHSSNFNMHNYCSTFAN